MYKKILLPLDGSELGEGILPYVGQIARGMLANVTVMYVTTLEQAASGKTSLVHVPEGQRESVSDYLREMREALERNGVKSTDALVRAGVPSVEIVEYSQAHGYDLIAMATHGRSGVGRWVYGSTTDKVLHSTSLPMLLLRPRDQKERAPGQTPIHTAIVPLDGSALAEAALPIAEDLAKRLSLKVALLRIVPAAAMIYGGFEPYAYDPRIDEEMDKAAEEYLKEKSDALKQRQVHVAYHRMRGYPANQIVDFAEETGGGLIVMSTHGRTGVGRGVLGSVADRVLRSTSLPILLLRSAEPKDEAEGRQ